MKMLRSPLIVCILFSHTCFGQLNTFSISDYYQPDNVFTGSWSIEMPKSYSREDGLFFTSFTFTEDVPALNVLNTKIANYDTFMLHTLGLDTVSNLKVVSAGKSKTGLYSFKKEEEINFEDTYLFIQADGFYKMILFFGEHDFKDEFGEAMIFHVTDYSRVKRNELVLANLDLRSEFFYKKVKDKENTVAALRKATKNKPNYYDFRGKVKSATIKVYAVKKLDGGTFLPTVMRSIIIMEFDKQGNKTGEKALKFNYGSRHAKWNILESKSSPGFTSIISNGVDPNYPDSIHISKNDSLETLIGYKKGAIHLHTVSQLVDGQKALTTYLSENSVKTIRYEYDRNGNLDYVVGLADQNDTAFEQAYYHLNFDDKGNWTRRINYDDRMKRDHKQMVTRSIVYY